MRMTLPLLLALFAFSSIAIGDIGPDPRLEQQDRVAQLEQENQALRQQHEQTAAELARLREELAATKAQLQRQAAATVTATRIDDAEAPVTEAPTASADADRAAALEAELQRLRRQNEDLLAQQTELSHLAGLAPTQERRASGDARITSESREGRIIVRTAQGSLRMTQGSRADHILSLGYAYDEGETPTPSTPVLAYIQTVFSGGLYTRASEVRLTVDGGETIVLPIINRDQNLRQTHTAGKRRINKSDETLTIQVTPEALRRLARATSASGRIGEVGFELSRDQLALFTAIHARLDRGL